MKILPLTLAAFSIMCSLSAISQSTGLRVTNTGRTRVEFRAYAIDPSCGMTVVSNWFALDGPTAPCSANFAMVIPPISGPTWNWYRIEISKAGSNVPNACSTPTPFANAWMFLDNPFGSCSTVYPSTSGLIHAILDVMDLPFILFWQIGRHLSQ